MAIKLPYINRSHLGQIILQYDLYADAYNETVLKDDPAGGQKTLKPTHRALFKDIVFETAKRMMSQIRAYDKIQLEQEADEPFKLLQHPYCGDGYFVCSTNRVSLSKLNRKEISTIYRNLRRLKDAGVIREIVGHGHSRNFELHIDSDLLLVSDWLTPEYDPRKENLIFSQNVAFCKVNKYLQEQLINKINSAGAVDKDNLPARSATDSKTCQGGKIEVNERTSSAKITTVSDILRQQTGTITRTGGSDQAVLDHSCSGQEKKNHGGAPDEENSFGQVVDERGINRMEVAGERKIVDGKIIVKSDPRQWHNFHRLGHSMYFIDYLIEKIYRKRNINIYAAARMKAIEYAEKNYFPNPVLDEEPAQNGFTPCKTLEDYAARLEVLKWCIDAANRYAARNNAYFVLIDKYIDLSNPTGFKGTFKWYATKRQNDADKAKAAKTRAELRKLHELIRAVIENPTYAERANAENYIEANLPKYIHIFRRSLFTITKQIDAEKAKPPETG